MDSLFNQIKKRKPDVSQLLTESQSTTVFEKSGDKEEELK